MSNPESYESFRPIMGGAEPSPGDPGPNLPQKDTETLIEEWRNAKRRVLDYPEGEYVSEDGVIYRYQAGTRLLVAFGDGEKEVMDTCETPWCNAAVDLAFRITDHENLRRPYRVLERGFGFGITARRIVVHLDLHGGSYTVIELNHKIAKTAKRWADELNRGSQRIEAMLPAQKQPISIDVIEADGPTTTEALAQEIAVGIREPFDIIFSDMYPQRPEDQGINDIKDADMLASCLEETGVLIAFGYFKGSPGGMTQSQKDLLVPNFADYHYIEIPNREFTDPIIPPEDYKYLQTPTGHVTRLPIIICREPKRLHPGQS